MIRTLTCLAVFVSVSLSGCIVVKEERKGKGSSRSALSSKEKDCKPSQYWDGHQCRHKGKGKGARKHDD